MRKRKSPAFILIELLVVISIIAVLIAVLLPTLGAIDDEIIEFPLSTSDPSDWVLITDVFDLNHKGRSVALSRDGLDSFNFAYPTDGLNVGHLDGSVIWKAAQDTSERYLWRTNAWKKF